MMYKVIDKKTLIPVLETERLILRPFKVTDADDIFEYTSREADPDNTRYVIFEPNDSVKSVRKFLADEIREYARGCNYDYALISKSDNKLLGTGGARIFTSSGMQYCAEIGYILNKKYWGYGYAAEAMRAVCAFLFDTTEVRRIQAKHFLGNKRSGRVMEKIGMSYEGMLKDYVFCRGEFHTCLIYSMIKDVRR